MMADPKPLRVAIGEDNLDLAEVLAMFIDLQPDLQCVGHAPTSTAFETLVDATLPDACIVDLQLADGSTLPLLRRLRAAHPSCRLVAFSGDGDPALDAACRSAGCDALVRKDGRPTSVVETLRQLRNCGEDPDISPGRAG